MEPDGEPTVVRSEISEGRVDYQIVAALAEATDRPRSKVPPLYRSIDPDALTALVDDRNTDVSIRFEHTGCTVTVADGVITVERNCGSS